MRLGSRRERIVRKEGGRARRGGCVRTGGAGRRWGLCDAFAEVEVEGERRATAIRPSTLSPVWNATFTLQSGRPAAPGAAAVIRLADHSLTGTSPIGCVRLPLSFLPGAGTTAVGPGQGAAQAEPEVEWHAIVDEGSGAPIVGLAGTCSGFDDAGAPIGMRRRPARLLAGAAVRVHLDVLGVLLAVGGRAEGGGGEVAGTAEGRGVIQALAALVARPPGLTAGGSGGNDEVPPSVVTAAELLSALVARSAAARRLAAEVPGLPSALVQMLGCRGFAVQRAAARLTDALALEEGAGRLALYLEEGLADALARLESRVKRGAAAALLAGGGLAECSTALRKLNASWGAVPMASRQRM